VNKLKNLDLAAFAAMVFTLLLEGSLHLAGNESLLATLPPWAPPLVLAVAAFARWQMAQPKAVDPTVPTAPKVTTVDSSTIAVPEHVDLDPTPVTDLWPDLDDLPSKTPTLGGDP
jgi:hypothetical protein